MNRSPGGADPAPGGPPGRWLVGAAWAGTAVFTVTAVAAAALPESPAGALAFVVALGLFLMGTLAFAAAFARAVSRSRAEVIGVTDLFLLTGGSAPPEVRRHLLGALGAQAVVALATSLARPYTILAAGTLVPVYGVGLCGLWAAWHGRFPPRRRDPGRRA